MKKCFKCLKTKSLDSFYKHPKMADGYLGKCKSCTKKDTRLRYYDPIARQKIIKYEKERFQRPERKAKALIYQKKLRAESPGKYRARGKVNNAIRDNRLKRLPCEVCGDPKSEAHHEDYRRYLQVKWLCRKHHMLIENKSTF